MSVSFAALLAGFSCKLYDDLDDNETISRFKNETMMEFLKGVHYICFTRVSLDSPFWFIFNYIINVAHHLTNKEAFSKPYEKSLFFSFGLLFFFINYNNIEPLQWFEYLILFGGLCSMFIEPLYNKSDYSSFKLIHRISSTLYFILLLSFIPNISNTMKYICLYSIGYFLLSAFIQFYSLYIYKKDDIIKVEDK
jgi:hypothetical protein